MVSTPQWNFRHELTYTEFTWSNYKINKSVFQKNETLVITLHVKNTGERDGIDLVQVFVSDLVASVTRPTYELKGFSRVAAKKGEVVSVEIQIPSICLQLRIKMPVGITPFALFTPSPSPFSFLITRVMRGTSL
eukprot:TRINITY_DN5561_c0_g2_i8.p2 TRINITY_DN5561_c0_g2~~TRINITY_DN5561_c0_g2_i8.p2  ORF type:complete len:134 (+),score=28.10 TRINITY_DN5561_c0_g2_i8:1838-2239(+)